MKKEKNNCLNVNKKSQHFLFKNVSRGLVFLIQNYLQNENEIMNIIQKLYYYKGSKNH